MSGVPPAYTNQGQQNYAAPAANPYPSGQAYPSGAPVGQPVAQPYPAGQQYPPQQYPPQQQYAAQPYAAQPVVVAQPAQTYPPQQGYVTTGQPTTVQQSGVQQTQVVVVTQTTTGKQPLPTNVQCCLCCEIRMGVQILAGFTILFALIGGIGAVLLLTAAATTEAGNDGGVIVYVVFVWLIFALTLFFGIAGFLGASNLNAKYTRWFFYYLVGYCVFLVIQIIVYFAAGNIVNAIFTMLISLPLEAYWAYVVKQFHDMLVAAGYE